jgi:hypothetical protein
MNEKEIRRWTLELLIELGLTSPKDAGTIDVKYEGEVPLLIKICTPEIKPEAPPAN